MYEPELEALTLRQRQIGYYPCDSLNMNALLGILTESSKVINEWVKQLTPNTSNFIIRQINHANWFLETIEELKNKIRDRKIELEVPTLSSERQMNWQEFDKLLGNVVYYVNALAICRGKTLPDYVALALAEISQPKWDQVHVGHCVPVMVRAVEPKKG